jgi:hypothetical protein
VIASPIRPRSTDRNRASLPRASSPHPRNALRRFTFVRHHDASTASFRPALTDTRPTLDNHADEPPGELRAAPLPINVGFPLSGSQDRTSTSDLKRHARHTRLALRARLRADRRAPHQASRTVPSASLRRPCVAITARTQGSPIGTPQLMENLKAAGRDAVASRAVGTVSSRWNQSGSPFSASPRC